MHPRTSLLLAAERALVGSEAAAKSKDRFESLGQADYHGLARAIWDGLRDAIDIEGDERIDPEDHFELLIFVLMIGRGADAALDVAWAWTAALHKGSSTAGCGIEACSARAGSAGAGFVEAALHVAWVIRAISCDREACLRVSAQIAVLRELRHTAVAVAGRQAFALDAVINTALSYLCRNERGKVGSQEWECMHRVDSLMRLSVDGLSEHSSWSQEDCSAL